MAAQKSAEFASTIGYLGTTVEADGSALPLQDGEAHALYSLAGTADQATLTIKDQAGRTVYTAPVDATSGRHEVTWDGRTSDGKTAPDGSYAFQISAKKRTARLSRRCKAIPAGSPASPPPMTAAPASNSATCRCRSATCAP